MNKLANYLFFFGTLARQLAKFWVPMAPQFKEMREFNSKDKLLTQLQNEIDNVVSSSSVERDSRPSTDSK